MPRSVRLTLLSFPAYFSNFVLLGTFVGIGLGFLRARARVNLFPLRRSRRRSWLASC